jgi:hypothetical protein
MAATVSLAGAQLNAYLIVNQSPVYDGRRILSALILDVSVVGFIFNNSAAPSGP